MCIWALQDGAAVWGQRESSAVPPETGHHAQGYQRAHVMQTLLSRRGSHTVAANRPAPRPPPWTTHPTQHLQLLRVYRACRPESDMCIWHVNTVP